MRLPPHLLLASLAVVAVGAPLLLSASVTLPHAFGGGTLADADAMGANFDALASAAEAQELRLEALEDGQVGSTRASALPSCKALLLAGATQSGLYWIKPGTDPMLVYCEQEREGGGWTLVHNSVGSNDTLGFWRIPYAERLLSRGAPGLGTNHYNGALYPYGREFLDVYVDLKGKEAVALRATTTGIDTTTMRFSNPALVSGSSSVFTNQFASGWSSFDYDGDPYVGSTGNSNCALAYNGVTQHYNQCWTSNLGSDADLSGGTADEADHQWGPHSSAVTGLGLHSDGSGYSRIQRMSRFARW